MRTLDFCANLAKAIHLGHKTTTWKPLPPSELLIAKKGGIPAMPFKIGSLCPMREQAGVLNGQQILCSSFTPEVYTSKVEEPKGFILLPGFYQSGELQITNCILRTVQSITEEEAAMAVVAQVNGLARDEFERQWKDNYKGAQSWDENPLCWVISFIYKG